MTRIRSRALALSALGLALVGAGRARGRHGVDRARRLDRPDALADPYRAEEGLLRRRKPQARPDLHPVERRAAAAACRGLARHRAVGRPGRSDLRHRQGRADLDRAAGNAVPPYAINRQGAIQEDSRSSRARSSWSTAPRASPRFTSSACSPRTTSSRPRSTSCSPARPRRASRRCKPARSTPPSCCRRSASPPRPPASAISG